MSMQLAVLCFSKVVCVSYRSESIRPGTSQGRTSPGLLKLTIVPDPIVRDNDRSLFI